MVVSKKQFLLLWKENGQLKYPLAYCAFLCFYKAVSVLHERKVHFFIDVLCQTLRYAGSVPLAERQGQYGKNSSMQHINTGG